ncbi:MAG: MBL fold metallo-hydrolase [Acholeplasma sp.]|nr:MBL fold metallo-hydrolase [Acholeplasma sp.]
MNIKKFTLGDIRSNCYVLYENHKAMIIDPGFDSLDLLNFLKNNTLDVKIIYATHGHFDHVGGINTLKSSYPDAIVYAPKLDEVFLDASSGVSRLNQTVIVDVLLEPDYEQTLDFESVSFKVIHTPGHSMGGTCLYTKGTLFSGDTLFYQTIGRTDLYGSSYESIQTSILNKLYLLPDDTLCYPGHGGPTTIGHEKKHNGFFRLPYNY